MKLTGLHLLLTYTCNYECDHCFVWSGPHVPGTMTMPRIDDILRQAKDTGTIEWIYFEGGEPFLYHAPLRHGVRRAAQMGFKVGIVSNAYWATDPVDAVEWLSDLAGSVHDLSVSCDRFHGDDTQVRLVARAREAAHELGIPAGTIEITPPDEADSVVGKLPEGESGVMHRGRAAEKLAPQAPKRPAAEMNACPFEDLRDPGRVHVDPYGNLHICQGIVIGNMFERPLREICDAYDADANPVTGPLLAGGPLALAHRHDIAHADGYADACHFCYEARRALRARFPEVLKPDQMYGVSA